ncbi:hypothetical protein O181_068730 [Austropuccinia psidii MF-1]|uniref:Association with the SNF1 complex (ASC) domain-containing protein n=1 Tax=Austropuccinia psidii MF-1 TaxID=1389203 RepID=A0A9Q3I7C3_9BASI|nr:hypothetical protein [Austropuccinia psidii MF-1]
MGNTNSHQQPHPAHQNSNSNPNNAQSIHSRQKNKLPTTAQSSLSNFHQNQNQKVKEIITLNPTNLLLHQNQSSNQNQNQNHQSQTKTVDNKISSKNHHFNQLNQSLNSSSTSSNSSNSSKSSNHHQSNQSQSQAKNNQSLSKRKSIQLIDIDPNLPSNQAVSPINIKKNHIKSSNSNFNLTLTSTPIITHPISHFQLKLPSSNHSNSISNSSPSNPIRSISLNLPSKSIISSNPIISSDSNHLNSNQSIPSTSNHPIINSNQAIYHQNDEDEDDSIHEDQSSHLIHSNPSIINQNPNLINLNSLSSTPSNSLAPLQQPIETVVPPLPPSILHPFPPNLPELDSNSLDLNIPPISNTLTPAVTQTIAAATAVVQATPALDIGAGSDGVPTLITWKEPAHEVYVTGTFSQWKQQIKLRKPPETNENSNQSNAFSALVALPPGPHRLKFIVDKRWKTSKYLPSATDDKGNLINYLQINPGDQPFRGLGPRGIWSGYTYGNWPSMLDDSSTSDDDEDWTTEIPNALLDYEEYHDQSSDDDDLNANSNHHKNHQLKIVDKINPIPGEAGFAAEPPNLPAQLKEGILNMASRLPEGASDDNSLLPKPDHSVLNHLVASPIKNGLLSIGVTSRYKRKYLTTVYYKPINLPQNN